MKERRERARQWRRLREEAPVLLPVLAVTLWYFRDLWLSADVIYGGLDVTRHFYFFKHATLQELYAGRLPLWTSDIYCGMPLLGSMDDQPFHPWNAIGALMRLPIPVIFNMSILLHLMAGQIGAYVWVRQDSTRRLPAALAACWIWNPFVLDAIRIGDHWNIRALLLVPAIFATLERGLDRPKFHGAWWWFGFWQALQILTMALQFVFYTCAIGGLTALGTFVRRWGRESSHAHAARMRWWLVATALALAVPMVQLLPGIEYGGMSERGSDVVFSNVWGIAPGQILSFVAPFVDPRDSMLVYWGIVPLWLAAVGIGAWRHPRRWWYFAILVGGLVLCIGAEWPVSAWLNSLPMLRRFRGPFRILLFTNLMLARFAAGGLDATLDRIEQSRHSLRWAHSARPASMLLGGLIVVACVWWPWSTFFSTWRDAIPTAIHWILAAGAIALVYRVRRRWVVGVLAVVMAADWTTHIRDYWHPYPVAPYHADATVAPLQSDAGDFRVWLRGTPNANYLSMFGVPSVAGHHPFPLRRTAKFLRGLTVTDARLLHLTQTRYVLTYYRPADGGPLGPPIASAAEINVQRVQGEPLPKYRVVGAGRWLLGEDAVWDVMNSGAWEPAASPVLLEGRAPTPPRPTGHGGSATLLRSVGTEREVAVESNGPGYLVIAETWYPGWEATVNGHPAPVLRGNFLFQAVPVDPGASTVMLRFVPRTVRVGLWASGCGLVALAVAYVMARRRDARVLY